MSNYDSRESTERHIHLVRMYLMDCVRNLKHRAEVHDASALKGPEKSFYDTYRPLLESVEYGSAEYMQYMEEFKPAIQHHYEANSHHPEHYENGVNGMSLFDLIEMFVDWRAAVERKGGTYDVMKSIEINSKRFEFSPQLKEIFENMAREMEW